MFFVIYKKKTGEIVNVRAGKDVPKVDGRKFRVIAFNSLPSGIGKNSIVHSGAIKKSDFSTIDDIESFVKKISYKMMNEEAKNNGFSDINEACMFACVKNPYQEISFKFVKWRAYVKKNIDDFLASIKNPRKVKKEDVKKFVKSLDNFKEF